MLTPNTRLRLQDILERIGADQPVTLQERIYVQKFADRDQGVAAWLLKARRRQRHQAPPSPRGTDGIDHLLDQLNLGPADPDGAYRPGEDDIEGWFGGAPGWVRRS
ncbi:MAG: hypothetical protein ACK59A_04920 [Cyanobacteriota bacterium]|jgi:hypothetical protein